MALGEPDEKGRRKPVGTGEFETLEVNSVIGAIGQKVDWGQLDVGALVRTKKGTAEADELTYQTAEPDILSSKISGTSIPAVWRIYSVSLFTFSATTALAS